MVETLNIQFANLLSRLSDVMLRTGEPMKSRAYKKAEETILGMTTEIKSVNDIKGKPGIGVAITNKLQEYLDTGKINVLEIEENKPEILLTNVYGIGPKKAKELVEKGITDIDTLKERQDLLNDVQRKGLVYYEDILKRIPRDEITAYKCAFEKVFDIIPHEGANFEIVGSYRRGQQTSGDIDVILGSPNPGTFDLFLDGLVKDKIIVEVLSRGKNKCLVVAKIPSSRTYRRVDFLYSTPDEYAFSVLYFTGSKGFNAVMRGHALKMGYSLNEHGFSIMEGNKKGAFLTEAEFPDERAIFDFLGLEYKEPMERIDGRVVVLKYVSPIVQTEITSLENRAFEEDLPSITVTEPLVEPIMKEPKTRKKREPKPKTTVEIISSPQGDIFFLKTEKTKKKREPKKVKAVEPDPIMSLSLPSPQILPLSEPVVQDTRKKRPYKKREKTAVVENISEVKTRKKREPKAPKAQKKAKVSDEKIDEKNIKTIEPISQQTMELIRSFKQVGMPVLETSNEDTLNSVLKYANDSYYNDTPVLSDNEYDIIKEYVEKKYPKAAVLQEIGAPIQGKNKVTLPFEMASMDKIKPDSESLPKWVSKYVGPYVLSCKLDGVSGMYVCNSAGKYKLYTRGNGKVGQDVSHLISVLKLPKITANMAIRGEFIVPKKTFTTKYADTFANARNMVSGIINRKSVDEKAHDLHFVTYEVVSPPMKPSEQMSLLKHTGFETVMNQTVGSLSNEMLSDLLLKWRKEYEYEIDGVIVTNDEIYGRAEGNPEHSFAFKMVISDQVAEAKVVDVLWEASKDGYLKPRVRIEPIQLGGVKIEYATGFNGKFIEDNQIGIGAVIMMVRSGDVIPYIKSVSVPAEKAKMPLIPYIWNKTHVDVLLENPEDDVTVQEKNVTAFFTSLEVDGLAKGNVKKLFAMGKNTVPKILAMKVVDFELVEGFKTKTAEKLYNGIKQKVDAASLLDIMVASGKLGRGLGERKIKPILEAYPDILITPHSDENKEAMLQSVSGIGKENAREFVKNIPDFLEFLKECKLEDKLSAKQAVPITNTIVSAADTSHPLYGKKIVMTKVRDKEIIDFMERHGATLENSMKKDVLVLIVKSKDDVSNKTEYAIKNKIPIMTVEEFKQMYM